FLGITPPYSHQQQFNPDAPDERWVTDITYIRTHEGWLYLAVVVDLFSRKIIGWSMQSRIELSLKPVGRHDTGLAFTSPRAPVSDLSLYPDTFHQSPDLVHVEYIGQHLLLACSPALSGAGCSSQWFI
ncbi:DDE-type integrase/transposase/recombinase, partial [Escherichia sp. HC-CC]